MTPAAAASAWARAALDIGPCAQSEPLPRGRGGEVWLIRDPESGREAVLKLAAHAGSGGDERLIAREATILKALAPCGLPVPECIAVDPSGRLAGTPALLMSRLPGSPLAGPDAVREAIPAMAAILVRCQQQTRNLVAGRRWCPWEPSGGFRVPSWSTREALWSRAIRVAQRFQPPACDAFIHRDPHPANLLFEGGDVSAVLDWPHAGRGPSGVDGARMAMNVCCLLGMDAATSFRTAFEQAIGRRQDPLLDVLAACEWLPEPALEPTARHLAIDLSRNQARGRLETFLADAMRRMTSRRLS